jgi:hypothetical protein
MNDIDFSKGETMFNMHLVAPSEFCLNGSEYMMRICGIRVFVRDRAILGDVKIGGGFNLVEDEDVGSVLRDGWNEIRLRDTPILFGPNKLTLMVRSGQIQKAEASLSVVERASAVAGL